MDISDTFNGEVSCPETAEQLIARLLYLHGERKKQHRSHRAETPHDIIRQAGRDDVHGQEQHPRQYWDCAKGSGEIGANPPPMLSGEASQICDE